MLNSSRNHTITKAVARLILAGSFFCVLFGQGVHLHDLALHLGDHLDVHVHVHAHESHDGPAGEATGHDDHHRHAVSTASDILGTLTPPLKISPEMKTCAVLSPGTWENPADRERDDTPTLFDLPPPGPASGLYYPSSFSLRGPPAA